MNTAIRLEKLGKKYRIRHEMAARYQSLRDNLANAFRPWKRSAQGTARQLEPCREDFWALRDIFLDIQKGERIGLIGRNGAGKSTLLKLISRITLPTEGRILLKGRVGTLLEVGTGFHPELTGRENIFLNGAILGMKKNEIRRKFDEIVAFSEIEKFLDMPVKRYSSGMYVRLAFAVAAHLEPDILLVDEVLAVGDHEFQKKCLGKMGAINQREQTIIFVSHNIQAIETLTQRCMVLSEGQSTFIGPTAEAVQAYLKIATQAGTVYQAEESLSVPRITYAEVKTSHPDNIQMHGEPMEIHMKISAPLSLSNAAFSLQVFNRQQQAFLHLSLFDSEHPWGREPGTYYLVCRIPRTRIFMGLYTLTLHFSERFGKKNPIKIEGVCPFEVVMPPAPRDFTWTPNSCSYIEDHEWEVKRS
jgi:lipopolysaccharide transport system ATP-binding protein